MRVANPGDLEIFLDDEHQRVGAFRSLHLVHYRRTPRVIDLQRAEKLHCAQRARHPGGTAVIAIADGGLTMPGADVRACADELLRVVAPHIRCSATILREDGFWASVAISVLTGLFNAVQRSPCPLRIFTDVAAAATWVTRHVADPTVRPLELAAVVLAFAEAPSERPRVGDDMPSRR